METVEKKIGKNIFSTVIFLVITFLGFLFFSFMSCSKVIDTQVEAYNNQEECGIFGNIFTFVYDDEFPFLPNKTPFEINMKTYDDKKWTNGDYILTSLRRQEGGMFLILNFTAPELVFGRVLERDISLNVSTRDLCNRLSYYRCRYDMPPIRIGDTFRYPDSNGYTRTISHVLTGTLFLVMDILAF